MPQFDDPGPHHRRGTREGVPHWRSGIPQFRLISKGGRVGGCLACVLGLTPDLKDKQDQALKKLRSKVLSQMSSDSPDWDSVKTAHINGKQTRVWSRIRPRGDFANIKTEAVINISPHDFLTGFLHDQRNQVLSIAHAVVFLLTVVRSVGFIQVIPLRVHSGGCSPH